MEPHEVFCNRVQGRKKRAWAKTCFVLTPRRKVFVAQLQLSSFIFIGVTLKELTYAGLCLLQSLTQT
ncbi:hypothetical protein CHARACLAT_008188 [Characodon lateralis]|uniref:Uncharacterized protein n=1 Tax=Characodon lateralis TaxID=208331 RepID=A0ABU7DPC8_9TELE|nr:hypothetical protein [Characodon lateralis]